MSTYKHGQLVITLKSDLCAGSGYSYAGIVDSDTCYDEYGIPYIPGRRIKGCMREAAESILYEIYNGDKIEEIFGKKGSKRGSDLLIENAYIEDYDSIRAYLARYDVCSAQEILDRYTHITGQTKLEDGVADPGSLRFTRLVNHYDPISQDKNNPQEMVFFADFSFAGDDSDWKMIEDAALATRHIGLKRNRGLGNVRIETKLKPMQVKKETLINCSEPDPDTGKVTISYAVRNVQPLMLSRAVEDESVDYIPGQQVIGLLAGRYLGESGRAAEDKAFKELFLNGHSIFSNLYPYDGGRIYYPAPDYMNRLKKTKKIVYNIGAELPPEEKMDKDSPYWYGDGNQPKKLKGKFVARTGAESVAVCEVKKEVVYHHSHRNKHEITGGKEEGILYSMEVVRRGQMFAGSIIVPSEYADIIKELLMEGDLSFGKSRTAQYGKCRLIEYRGEDISHKQFDKGRDIVVTFLSDAIIQDENGSPTIYYDKVRPAIASMLGIEDNSNNEYLSSLQVTTATGYMGTWNLRRPATPAIRAGSFLVYHLNNATIFDDCHIGERTLEGYGLIRIDYADECKYDGIKNDFTASCEYSGVDSRADVSLRTKVNQLIVPVVYDRWLNRKINNAITKDILGDVSNTSVGRFTLMLRESISELGKECKDEKQAFIEFSKRINSIKYKETKREGEKILKILGKKCYETYGKDVNSCRYSMKNQKKKCDSDDCSYLYWIIDDKSSFVSKEDEELRKDLNTLGLDIIGQEDDVDEKIKRWPQYVLAILTDRKYRGR